MDADETISQIDRARALVQGIRDTTDSPLVERCMQLAEMNLHWAKWCLGGDVEIAPELDERLA
ncbi:MAG: hypothetical protein Q8O86_02500 [Dehalococcoidia bacterium]|nr:hypothetical protein [Dehalococcoidia bacterium]